MTREEAIMVLKDCELNPCVQKDKEVADMAIKAIEQRNKILQILDDYELEAWEILEMIKEVVRV